MADEKTAGAPKAAPAKPAATAKSAAGSGDDNLIGGLCYVPIFFLSILVPLYIFLTEKKQNKVLAFHAWQALLTTIAVFVVFMALGIINFVVSLINGGLGMVLNCPFAILGLAVFVVMCLVAWKVYNGEKYMLPVVGAFADKQANK